jgi:hypothetical protein
MQTHRIATSLFCTHFLLYKDNDYLVDLTNYQAGIFLAPEKNAVSVQDYLKRSLTHLKIQIWVFKRLDIDSDVS